ncbi:MAG: T9SS type A sorting domain-containing protein, partial [Melioribacteraceae bacterium]
SGEGRNTFENNYYGIYTNYYSDVHAGDNSTSYHRNRFINNTYHIYANNNSNVYAKYCYWNPQDFVNKIVKLNNSNVYTDNPISDPGMSVNRGNDEFLSASSVGEDNNEKKILLDMLKNYYTTNDKTIKKSTKDFVKDLLSIKSKTDDITPFVIEILSNIEMYDKELNEVIKLNESLVTDYKNTIYAKNGFMNLFFAYYEMNDYKNASQALSQISEQYQNNDEVLFAKWLIGSEEESIKFGKKSEAQETEGLIPINFQLIGNYPNPFNPTTTITYILPSDGLVQVKVFDILGREIETLVNDFKSSGKHSILWDGSKFASGMYFCSVAFKNQTLYKKMLMVK